MLFDMETEERCAFFRLCLNITGLYLCCYWQRGTQWNTFHISCVKQY